MTEIMFVVTKKIATLTSRLINKSTGERYASCVMMLDVCSIWHIKFLQLI